MSESNSTTSPTTTATTVTKRKLIELVSTLDKATSFNASPTNSSKSGKRRRVSPTSTPNLISLLATSSSSSLVRSQTPPPIPLPNYSPNSLSDLISRISTFNLINYSPGKPKSISILSCALLGWTNTGKERLECVSCKNGFLMTLPSTTSSSSFASTSNSTNHGDEGGWNSSKGQRLLSYNVTQLRESHAKNCPWRITACSSTLYKLPRETRSETIENLKKVALAMEREGLGKMNVVSGLEEEEVKELGEVIRSFKGKEKEEVEAVITQDDSLPLSTSTILLALFGWALHSNSSTTTTAATTSNMITCTFCTRKVLFSSYLPSSASSDSIPSQPSSKTFNLVTQHQSFCPFITTSSNSSSSTTLPSSPTTSSTSPSSSIQQSTSPIPGWELRTNVILSREASGSSKNNWSIGSEKLKVGTKELMSYVRELLGPKSRLKK